MRDDPNILSRRRLLGGGLGLGGALLVAGAGQRTAWGQDATPESAHEGHADAGVTGVIPGPDPWRSEDLLEPEVRGSAGGILDTQLHVRYAAKDVGGYRLYLRTYDGMIPGPTLRIQPGDTLRITLHNRGPDNRDVAPRDGDMPYHFNSTNVHFHGSHVSPQGISDNVLRTMEPGGRYDVEFVVPSNHTRGTYWYHPHRYGSADVQVASGMSGAVIIAGDFADVPEIASAKERLLLLNQAVFDPWRTVEDFSTVFPAGATRFLTVNGQREPIIRMRPGEVQRWRILNAGYEDSFAVALDGHLLHPIARDGIPLAKVDQAAAWPLPKKMAEPAMQLIAPGQRIDVLVQAGEAGSYPLRGLSQDEGDPSPTGLFAHVVVAGDPLPMSLPAALPTPPLTTIRDEELTGARQITFSRITPEAEAAGHWQEFTYLVDGNVFDDVRVDQRVRLGAVEEWTITNQDPQSHHIFHIHVNPFQVTKMNDQLLAEPVWLDSAMVPPNGSMTIRSRFLDFTGKYVLHCHMMNHEDLGMMQVVEVT